MSEGPKHVKAKTRHTVFVLFILLRKQLVMSIAQLKFSKNLLAVVLWRWISQIHPLTSQSNISKNQMMTYGMWEVLLVKMKSANFSLPLRKMLVYRAE